MDTWTPLFSSIIHSSVWGEAKHVRIVWVTMLAIKDRHGYVAASVPGLARAAVVTTEECLDALRVLEAPDGFSKDPEHDGRRVKAVDGGWLILGHERYQKKMKEVTEKIGNAKRQRVYRLKKKDRPLPGEGLAEKARRDGMAEAEVEKISEAFLPDKECPL